MVIVYKSYNDAEVVDLVTGRSYRDATVYCEAAEVDELPVEEFDEGCKLYITDWKKLDASIKSSFDNTQIHILGKNKQWLPL